MPIGYVMSRYEFRGKPLIDTLLDIPIVLPPLVVGLSLLILFRYAPDWLSDSVVYKWPAVVLAQFMVACAFAVRTMRVSFDQIPQRYEQVALTLGCNRQQAFWRVIMPQAKGGLLAAATLSWARALGEFGPILVFAGATRQNWHTGLERYIDAVDDISLRAWHYYANRLNLINRGIGTVATPTRSVE